jgi:hypothetical protein
MRIDLPALSRQAYQISKGRLMCISGHNGAGGGLGGFEAEIRYWAAFIAVACKYVAVAGNNPISRHYALSMLLIAHGIYPQQRLKKAAREMSGRLEV